MNNDLVTNIQRFLTALADMFFKFKKFFEDAMNGFKKDEGQGE